MIGLMLTLILLGYFVNRCMALSGAVSKCKV
jgi:hypothetical protein